MDNISKVQTSANTILAELVVLERNYQSMVERNASLVKGLATIKSLLERTLRQPQNLNDAVYESINLARSLTPYTNSGKIVIDPPLTEEEKVLK